MDEESEFDSVIEAVGNNGKFQNRFNWAFNFALIFVAAMPYQNIINALAVPDHWCFIPGRESSNYTLDEWKQQHLPNCENGWEYDKTWYDQTAPSQGSWVCNDTIHVANAFIFSRLGEVIGSMIFGQLADTIGRKPVFFMTVILVAVGRMLLIVTWHSVPLFFLVMFLGSFPSYSIFQGPLVIAMEISKIENRAYIAMLQCVSATLGVCSLPLMMWVLRDWRYFIAVSTLPCIAFVFFGRFMIESPRWLANRGKMSKCIRELEKIAKVNKTKVPNNIASILSKFNGEREMIYGVMGLFSSWRLTKNGILLMIGWSSAMLIYYTFTFNINNLEGNPFMNFFWQGIAEIPAYFAAKYTSDYLGRRWTNFIAFAGTFLGCIPILFIIHDESLQLVVSGICVFIKFFIGFSLYGINLQSLEIYPTCIRQMGISLSAIVGNAFGIFAPYIVFLGTEFDPSYPYKLSAALGLLGIACGVFLPETLNQKLPETLAEAADFGCDQDFWGKRKKRMQISQIELPLRD